MTSPPTSPARRPLAVLAAVLAALTLALLGGWRLRGAATTHPHAPACDAPGASDVRAGSPPRGSPATHPTTYAPATHPAGADPTTPSRREPVAATPQPAPPTTEIDPLVAGNVDLARRALELATLAREDAATTSARAQEYEVARRAQEARLLEAGVLPRAGDDGGGD